MLTVNVLGVHSPGMPLGRLDQAGANDPDPHTSILAWLQSNRPGYLRRGFGCVQFALSVLLRHLIAEVGWRHDPPGGHHPTSEA